MISSKEVAVGVDRVIVYENPPTALKALRVAAKHDVGGVVVFGDNQIDPESNDPNLQGYEKGPDGEAFMCTLQPGDKLHAVQPEPDPANPPAAIPVQVFVHTA